MKRRSFLITGGYGFIGSNFVNWVKTKTDCDVYILDKISYASDLDNITVNIKGQIQGDLASKEVVDLAFSMYEKFDAIFHFAAESHVDNSINGPVIFTESNVLGTHNLLEAWRKTNYGRFIHISTDEVYGHLSLKDVPFTEETPLDPRSPYSASKAASDLIVKSYFTTYGSDVLITRCCNNYGPRQHIEKFIPKIITNILNDKHIPLYGTGMNRREWIHVMDHVEAIFTVYEKGESGEIYNIGSGIERANISIIADICDIMNVNADELIDYVEDRKGHDFRYAIDSTKIAFKLGWEPKYTDHAKNLQETIDWYKSAKA